jgi:hypothetical protein
VRHNTLIDPFEKNGFLLLETFQRIDYSRENCGFDDMKQSIKGYPYMYQLVSFVDM